MFKLIAITGGIGSGKSTVSKIISELGHPVLSCDAVYADLLQNEDFVCRVSDAVGVAPIILDGVKALDRAGISKKVFAEPELRRTLEAVTHPAIMDEVFARAKCFDGTVFVEVPLLFEAGLANSFDKVIIVKRALNQRLSAVCKRDGVTEDSVKNRIKNQFDYENNSLNGHTVICNDLDLTALQKTVEATLNDLFKENT